jgi:hypothetical protein
MEQSVDRLNSFLREESTAVEAYKRVLSVVKSPKAREGLDACYRDHQGRVEELKSFIEAHGVTPREVPSRKGFGRIPGMTEAIPDRSVVDILEEGEQFELQDYERYLGELDAEDRRFVEERLLPAQRATLERLRAVRQGLH